MRGTQRTVLGGRDFVRLHFSCLSTIVPIRLSNGLECSPPLALVQHAGCQQGVQCTDHHDRIGASSQIQQKGLEYLQYLSEACNPIMQLKQHLHISKPQVNQIKYDYKPKTKRETRTVQW